MGIGHWSNDMVWVCLQFGMTGQPTRPDP